MRQVSVLIIGIVLLLSTSSVARTLPTWHATGDQHRAMLVIPPSEVPVIVRVVDAQQRVLLRLTLDATQGVREPMNFTWLSTGHYALEVDFEQKTLYKTLSVQDDRVQNPGGSEQFRTVPHFEL